MTKRLALRKRFIVLFFFAILLAIQIVSIRSWHYTYFSYFLQTSILDIAIMLGIYAFKGFDNSTIRSLNAGFVSYIFGTILGSLLAVLIVLIFFYPRIPRNVFIITDMISAFIFPILSYLFMKMVIQRLPTKTYLVIGKENEFSGIMNEIEKVSMEKIRIYHYMNPSAESLLKEISNPKEFDSILIGDIKLAETVENTLKKFKNVEYLPYIVENILEKIPLSVIGKFKEYYEISFKNTEESPAERGFDIIFSMILLILFSPVMALIAWLILLEDGRPIIFSQYRIGKNGEPFKFYKFRSLRMENSTNSENPNANIEKRATKIGRIIRKIRFDEIPQFWNVLKGEMSIVGPRPEMKEFHDLCMREVPFYENRLNVKPGITGWAQINYKHTSTLDDYKRKTEYDLWYVKSKSVFLDLKIALQTIETMLGMKGAR